MNAFFARNRLSAYLDGELSAEDAAAVEAALADDAALREELSLLRETAAVLRGPDVRAPVGFAQRVSARVAVEPPPSAARALFRRMGGARTVAVVAAALLLGIAGVGAWQARTTGEAVAGAEDAPTVEPLLEPAGAAGVEDGALDPASAVADAEEDAPDPRALPSDDPSTARELLARTEGRASTELAPSVSGLPAGTTGKGKGEHAGSARGTDPAPSAPRSAGRGEREAYVADWERSGDVPAVAVTATTVEYRVVSATENGLKELSALARSLGGELRDSRGDAVATYPMESGEARIVRLVVPAARLSALGAALARVGEVQVVAETGAGLYAPEARVPVRVEIVAP